jgi:ribonuclease J
MFGGSPQGRPTGDPLADEASFWSYAGSKGLAPIPAELPAGLSIRHWSVDHSIPGATSYAVETGAGWVAYTGDLRFHGARGDAAWTLAHELSELRPALLLCEGTRLGDSRGAREDSVLGNCLEAVRRSQGRLVVADFAPRNVERLLTFLRIAGETSRRLLVQPKDAYLLRAMHLADPSTADAMEDPRLGLYQDPKLTEREWEVHLRERYQARTVTPLEVRQEPGDYILAFSLTDIADLLDIDYLIGAEPGGAYIFSNSPAYDDEQMVDLVRLCNWVRRLGMELVGLEPVYSEGRREVTKVVPVPGFHASGHASEVDLLRFAQIVRPKRLVAIHTESPDRWLPLLRGSAIEVVVPELGAPIPV